MLMAACAGKKQEPTTPEKVSQSPKAKVTYEGQGSDLYTGAADEAMPLPETRPEAPKAADAPDPKLPVPPAQELSRAQREQLVAVELRRGVNAMKANDTDGVIRAARAALDVDETSVEAMIMLAHGNYLKGYDDKAEAVLNLAKKQRAGEAHPVLWMLLGLIYDRTDRDDQALAAYERATQLKPDYLAALTNRGAIYLERKRYADAVAVFEQVVKLHAQSARAHTHLGAAYRGRSAELAAQKAQRDRLLRRAEQELKLAMEKDPAYAPAYFNLGILYLDADPFPGMEPLARLQQAHKYLADYKRRAGPRGVDIVDDHLAAAQKGIEREQKLLERRRRREAGGGTQ
jgi:tetratricopeptide (TPR) repeat protein